MTLNDLERGFNELLRDFGLRHAFQEWIAPKALEIDQKNMCMKFLALNVDFNSLRFDPQWVLCTGASNFATSNGRFLLLSTNIAYERLQIGTAFGLS